MVINKKEMNVEEKGRFDILRNNEVVSTDYSNVKGEVVRPFGKRDGKMMLCCIRNGSNAERVGSITLVEKDVFLKEMRKISCITICNCILVGSNNTAC